MNTNEIEAKEGQLYAPSTIAGGKPIPMRIIGRKPHVTRQRVSVMAVWAKKLIDSMNGSTDNRPTSFANLKELALYFAPKWPSGWGSLLMSKWESGKTHTMKCGAVLSSDFEGDARKNNEIRVQWGGVDEKLLTAAQIELLDAIRKNIPFAFVNGANFISMCRAVGIAVPKRAKTDQIKNWGDSCEVKGVCTLVGLPIIGGGRSSVGKQRNYLKQNFDEITGMVKKAKERGVDIALLAKQE